MKGSGRNTMPVPGVDFPQTEKMAFYGAVGHGTMQTVDKNRVFMVPEKTWVMFTSRSTEPTPKIKDEDALYNEFRSLKPGETQEQWRQRIYAGMKSGTLFKSLLYQAGSPEKGLSIYEPGDVIQDMMIVFRNERPPWGDIGIWQLPLPPDHVQHLHTIRKEFDASLRELPEIKELVETVGSFVIAEASDTIDDIDVLLDFSVAAHAVGLERALESAPDSFVLATVRYPSVIDFIQKLMNIQANHRKELAAKQLHREQEFYGMPNNLTYRTKGIVQIPDHGPATSLHSMLTTPSLNVPEFNVETRSSTYPYRFFLIEACRSLTEEPSEEAVCRVRSMSSSVRSCQDCLGPKLFANAKTLKPFASVYSPVEKLLGNQDVEAGEFEAVWIEIQKTIPPGTKIKFTGMEKNPELNDTTGTIVSMQRRADGTRVYRVASDFLKKEIPVLMEKVKPATGGRRKTRKTRRRYTRRR